MPAPATPIDELPAESRAILDDVARVSAELASHEGTVKRLTAERHNLFAQAVRSGVALSTVARVAGVSAVAVKKAADARPGEG